MEKKEQKSLMNGADIKEFRKREGLSQQRLSELVDVDVTTVSRWERDLAAPGPDAHAALSQLMTRPLLGSLPIELLKSLIIALPTRVDLLRGDGILLAESQGITSSRSTDRQVGARSTDFAPDAQQAAVEAMFGGYENFYREAASLSLQRVEYVRPYHLCPSDHRVAHFFNTEIGPCYLHFFTYSDEPLKDTRIIAID